MFLESFELVAERSRCVNGSGQYSGRTSVQGCADKCRKYAVSMFAIERTERCGANCQCFCTMSANPNGTCVLMEDEFYDTYKIVTGK